MKNKIQQTIVYLIFAAGAGYGLWSFSKLLSVIFNLGEDDTAAATLAILLFGLAPLPASFLALRWRKTACVIFTITAIAIVIGFRSDAVYMAARNGTKLDSHRLAVDLVRYAGPLFLFAVFHLLTDLLHWPKISKVARLQASKPEA
jgi:hypothetical protein